MFIEQISGQNIKIKFDISETQLLLGDILKIISSGKNGVLAQIIGISTDEKTADFNIAESKILYTIDSSGKLINWQGNLPSQDFIINKISAEETLLCSKALNPENPVFLGNLALYPDVEANLEASFFEHPTVIFCDKQTQKNNILEILAVELSKNYEKVLLVDYNGDYQDLKVSHNLKAGQNFKLPFDTKGLELLYNKTLPGVSPETRAAIEDIFIEIENYLSSGKIEFIPFSNFYQAVESVYQTNKIPELVLLKNKLLKLGKYGIFADKKQEITGFSESIKADNIVILDLSKFHTDWQRDIIEFIVDSNITKHQQKFFLLIDFDKITADKILIEKLFSKAVKSGIYPIIATGHDSEFAGAMMSYAKNIIAFAPENTTKIAALKNYLVRLKDNEAVIMGKVTNNIPLYVDICNMDDFEENDILDYSGISNQTSSDIYLNVEVEQKQKSIDSTKKAALNEGDDDFNYSNQFAYDESEIELIDNISRMQEEINIVQETDSYDAEVQEEDDEEALDEEEEEEISEESSYADQSLYDDDEDEESGSSENSSLYDEEEIQEDNYNPPVQAKGSSFYDEFDAPEDSTGYKSDENYDSGFSEDDLSNFVDDSSESGLYDTAEQKQGDEDFDYYSNESFQDESVLDYTGENQNTAQGSYYDEEPKEENSYAMEDYFSEDDETPSNVYSPETAGYEEEYENEVQTGTSVMTQEPPSSPSKPDIPIYETPKSQTETSSDVEFKEGDEVRHEKYGAGTITKIIGSHGKSLCSIQFEEVGKRLLDPKLSALEKIR